MQVQIRWSGIDSSEALAAHVDERVAHALRHCKDVFTRVDVHLHDDNAAKAGSNDKRCVIEARPRGADPLVVDSTDDDFYKTVSSAAKKLERAAHHFIDRKRKH